MSEAIPTIPIIGQPVAGAGTVLDVYGSLLYAGARTLGAHLPDPADARSPVVVSGRLEHTRPARSAERRS